MADDIELPAPDGETIRLTDGFDSIIWKGRTPAHPGTGIYLEATVRGLLAAAVTAERERLRAQHDECPLWPGEDGR